MRGSVTTLGLILAIWCSGSANAQPPNGKITKRIQSPSTKLGQPPGTYVVIEGVKIDYQTKGQDNTLIVDTVNGQRLKKPIHVLVTNVELPPKQRCKLKGYENGKMIGRPPAEYAAAKELGYDWEKLVRRDATSWRWQSYFVALIATEPKGLEIQRPITVPD